MIDRLAGLLSQLSYVLVAAADAWLPPGPDWLPAAVAAAAILRSRLQLLAWSVVLLLSLVPLLPTPTAVWHLAWVVVLVTTLTGILVSGRIAVRLGAFLARLSTRTNSPIDDLLTELAGRIVRLALLLLVAGIGGSPLLPEIPLLPLALVGSIGWAAWQGVSMLDRLLLGRDLSAKDNLATRRVAGIQVVEAGERTITVRALVSAADASAAWDLRCAVREGLIRHLAIKDPRGLPQIRFAPLDACPVTAAPVFSAPATDVSSATSHRSPGPDP